MAGPGGYEIRLSPGSEVYDLLDSEAGHQMLPCNQFAKGRQPSQDNFTFLVGTHFEKKGPTPSGGDHHLPWGRASQANRHVDGARAAPGQRSAGRLVAPVQRPVQ